jgi:hypothetical protein
MLIDASHQIAETLYFSLRCVDSLQGKGLNSVFDCILEDVYNVFETCVDLAPETLTG